MIENKEREEISHNGKNALIQRLSEFFKLDNSSSICGVECNASVFNHADKHTVFASQLYLEHIHFDLTYFPIKHLGYKLMAATMTDILAMNGIPSQVRLNLGVSNRFSVDALEEFSAGASICCKKHNIDLTGLDVTSSAVGFAVSVSMVGTVEPDKLVKQEGAAENELICVSGDFGAAYGGLILLERAKKVFQANSESQPDFAGYDYLLERQLKPEPRLEIIQELKKADILPTSMINVKDGLASALIHICDASKKGCLIFEEKLPIDTLTFNTLKDFKIVATMVALNGGEDYELLFTVKQSDYDKVKNLEGVSVIGYITAESSGKFLISNDNKQIALTAQEYYGEKE